MWEIESIVSLMLCWWWVIQLYHLIPSNCLLICQEAVIAFAGIVNNHWQNEDM